MNLPAIGRAIALRSELKRHVALDGVELAAQVHACQQKHVRLLRVAFAAEHTEVVARSSPPVTNGNVWSI